MKTINDPENMNRRMIAPLINTILCQTSSKTFRAILIGEENTTGTLKREEVFLSDLPNWKITIFEIIMTYKSLWPFLKVLHKNQNPSLFHEWYPFLSHIVCFFCQKLRTYFESTKKFRKFTYVQEKGIERSQYFYVCFLSTFLFITENVA